MTALPAPIAGAREFERASESRDIEAMMRMALDHRLAPLRRWAAMWLKENCNVVVVDDSETKG